jgi:hypothetical protein
MRRRLVVSAGVVGLLAVAAPASASVEGPCSAEFNGVSVDSIDGLGNPLELTVQETLIFSGSSDPGVTAAKVAIAAGPFELDTATTSYATPADAFTATIDLEGLAPYAVGLFRIQGAADDCTAGAWLRVTGRSPLATLAGLTGAGLALGGLTGQLGAIASRRRLVRTAAAAGGVATGAGIALLAQGFGRLQPSIPALALSMATAMSAGVVLAKMFNPALRGERRDRATKEIPTPVVEAAQRVMRPKAAEEQAQTFPYWAYVLSDVEVRDLDDHTRVVGHMQPGTWYLVKRESGQWAHVSHAAGLEGWAARHAMNRD